MGKTILALASMVALSLGWAGMSRAETVAGWDFSQYFSDGLLSVDGATFTNALNANYSSLDPTHNAGAESAPFGRATLGTGVLPTAGSLESNLSGAASRFGENGFDAHSVLSVEGQPFREYMALTSPVATDVVFRADLSSVAQTGQLWSVSFGGKTLSGTSTVAVSMSADGSGFANYGSVALTTTDSGFALPLSTGPAKTVQVRLSLDPSLGQPVIDNVAVKSIFVPEPAFFMQMGAGLVGLFCLQRRRIGAAERRSSV